MCIRLSREATDYWLGPLRGLRRRQRLLDALAELHHAAINLLHPRVEGLDGVDLLARLALVALLVRLPSLSELEVHLGVGLRQHAS